MAVWLFALVIIVGLVLLLSTRSARRERRLPPYPSWALSEGRLVVRSDRFRRALAWVRRVLSEANDRSSGRPSSSGGFGGFGGCGGGGGGGGGGCGGSGGC